MPRTWFLSEGETTRRNTDVDRVSQSSDRTSLAFHARGFDTVHVHSSQGLEELDVFRRWFHLWLDRTDGAS